MDINQLKVLLHTRLPEMTFGFLDVQTKTQKFFQDIVKNLLVYVISYVILQSYIKECHSHCCHFPFFRILFAGSHHRITMTSLLSLEKSHHWLFWNFKQNKTLRFSATDIGIFKSIAIRFTFPSYIQIPITNDFFFIFAYLWNFDRVIARQWGWGLVVMWKIACKQFSHIEQHCRFYYQFDFHLLWIWY